MAEIVKMPKLSDTMTEGVVSKWYKKVGETIESGELLADIETDKATMEYESFQEGTILHIAIQEGETAPVDGIMAIVGEKDEKFDDLLNATPAAPVSESVMSTPVQDAAPKAEAVAAEVEPIDVSSVNATIVKMPKLSDTMTEGTIAQWHKKIGDQVSSGDLLVEIETDKATMEFESFDDGELLYIGVEEQNSAPVDDILAIIGEKGADYQKLIDAHAQQEAKDEKPEPAQSPAVPAAVAPSAPKPAAVSTPVSTPSSNGRIKASPLAKRLAQEKNISLSQVKGTGEGGRIIRRDIDNFQPAVGGGMTMPGLTEESFEEVPLSQMRKTIARRLGESKFTAPHFYLTISIDMDQAIQSRKAIMEAYDSKISYNDMVIKAAAAALTKHPQVNASWQQDHIRYNKHVSIGVAVAVDEGLLVPVVRYADTKSFFQINQEVKDYATRARDKKLQPEEWEGSTFTISNLGMFGIEEFTAIINPPDACIMAVGGINEVPVVRNGEIVIGHVMKVTMSCDHRVVDGATGAAFLQTFKKYMENPITIFV